ncbi:S26 family signal peptidase [Sphingomonas sp. H39-1-10]|uniref:S26 family signal peptidase n=1 Tax=Sphingomonas pollutisoli TaxID=3030829 RepID=UPI0023B8AF8D|nr:S26 family signal peptidase [Sphingomonas pollutisoli]MDF0490463.1 S26 family signal peptidase [Sphingomonas pollutisoli]
MPAARTEPFRPRWRLWILGAASLWACLALGALAAWRDGHALLINASDSLPNWAFFIERNKAPVRGDYIFFDPPASALLTRHFGKRAGPFGKRVIGLPGERVEHRGALVLVAGRVVAHMKPRTRLGEPLTPGATGMIPQGCYYVGTDHPDGFDSRYAEIGFICRRRIIGTGSAIL